MRINLTTALAELEEAADLAELAERPRRRGECIGGERPCPWVSCRYHLAIDVSSAGSVKIPGVKTMRLERASELDWHRAADLVAKRLELAAVTGADTCALDVADRGEATLGEIGDVYGVTRERARQELNLYMPRFRQLLDSH